MGDGGLSAEELSPPILSQLKHHLEVAPENSTALFLGDNVYPKGVPNKKQNPEAYQKALHHLEAQLQTLEHFKGRTYFIPGNHDWLSDGLIGLKRQQRYLEKSLDKKKVLIPENGCGIEKININNQIVLLAIDSQWYLEKWDQHPGINENCSVVDREQLFDIVEDVIKKNTHKSVVIALHHPIFSYGPHGGQFGLRQAIFPNNGVIPTPFLGALFNLIRKTSGASVQDLQNERYRKFSNRLSTLAQLSKRVIFVSGHEHSLQYVVEKNTPQIISGSLSKQSPNRLIGGSKFASSQKGFAVLDIFKDGSSAVYFYEDINPSQIAYKNQVLPPLPKINIEFKKEKFPKTIKASVYTNEEIDKTMIYRKIWGNRYRNYYGLPVQAQVVRLDTLLGGLAPVRKGGGHQTKSLRLEDSLGNTYSLRALKKSTEIYFQSQFFKERYILGSFENTIPFRLAQDFLTGAHPYAPFTVPFLAKSIGVYHLEPKLYYVPKQSALGIFNHEFGDELYTFEPQISKGKNRFKYFGNAQRIESTEDMLNHLNKNEKHRLDEDVYIRARLFDMLLGDWDRHPDQWRWAAYKNPSGITIYKPIPRDRDQVFSIMGDGWLMGLATRIIGITRIMEGFNNEIRSVEGFNSSPRTFSLDMALLSQTSLVQWEKQARYIQKNITPQVIKKALKEMPSEVQDNSIQEITQILLSRKNQLVQTAQEYFKVLNRHAVVTGTQKDDFFEVNQLPDGNVHVSVYQIKDDVKTHLYFSKIYDPKITKEVWLYGLDDKDVFEVTGKNSKIKIRLIGGPHKDQYISQKKAKPYVYDRQDHKNKITKKAHLRLTNDYNTNLYHPEYIKANTSLLIPSGGFNRDDGIFLGATKTWSTYKIQKNPFTQRHQITPFYYLATGGVDLTYSGEFAHIFNGVNLGIEAHVTSPNYARNFFGFGNETKNLDDDLDLDYNRVRIQTIRFQPSLLWYGEYGSIFSIFTSYENHNVEKTTGRFIQEYFAQTKRDNQQEFWGIGLNYSFKNTDSRAYPRLGLDFKFGFSHKVNLSKSNYSFNKLNLSLAIDHKLTHSGSVVFSTKWGTQILMGSDEYEFYQAAYLGGKEGLRGYRFERFSGKRSYYQSTDLRLKLPRQLNNYLTPFQSGIYGSFDYGRVWMSNDESSKWHSSFGGGFFLNAYNVVSANIGVFSSDEDLRFYFGIGFQL